MNERQLKDGLTRFGRKNPAHKMDFPFHEKDVVAPQQLDITYENGAYWAQDVST